MSVRAVRSCALALALAPGACAGDKGATEHLLVAAGAPANYEPVDPERQPFPRAVHGAARWQPDAFVAGATRIPLAERSLAVAEAYSGCLTAQEPTRDILQRLEHDDELLSSGPRWVLYPPCLAALDIGLDAVSRTVVPGCYLDVASETAIDACRASPIDCTSCLADLAWNAEMACEDAGLPRGIARDLPGYCGTTFYDYRELWGLVPSP